MMSELKVWKLVKTKLVSAQAQLSKLELQSDAIIMQPDKTKCHLQRPITMYGLQDAEYS